MVVLRWITGAGLAFLAAGAAVAGTPAFPASAAGDWAGTVQAKGAPRHLFPHIHKTHDGVVAVLNSPEGSAEGAVVQPLAADEGILVFAVNGGQFRGHWSDAEGRWEGTWTEAGVSTPLILSFNADGAMRTSQRIVTKGSGAR